MTEHIPQPSGDLLPSRLANQTSIQISGRHATAEDLAQPPAGETFYPRAQDPSSSSVFEPDASGNLPPTLPETGMGIHAESILRGRTYETPLPLPAPTADRPERVDIQELAADLRRGIQETRHRQVARLAGRVSSDPSVGARTGVGLLERPISVEGRQDEAARRRLVAGFAGAVTRNLNNN